MDWSNLFSAALGSVVGAAAATYAADKTHNHNVALQDYQRQREIDGLLFAMHQELLLAGEVYAVGTGAFIEKLVPGQSYHDRFFRMKGEYFQAFRDNVAVIGQLENPDLAKAIFDAYAAATALTEQLHINNEYLDRKDQASREFGESKPALAAEMVNRWESLLVEHGKLLKGVHEWCKRSGARATQFIADYRVAHPPIKPLAASFFAKVFGDDADI